MVHIIAHIIGMDEIHKRNFIKELPNNIKILDIDAIQQLIYNDKDIVEQKKLWSEISQKINVMRKQSRLLINKSNFQLEIKDLLNDRKEIKKRMHEIWKDKMSLEITNKLESLDQHHVVIIGFNIFPKDYRVKVNLPIKDIATTDKVFNKIIYEIDPKSFASNQIKFYLKCYSNKIIKGNFALNLLDVNYLSTKYDKFTTYYQKLGYEYAPKENLMDLIKKLDEQINELDTLPEYLYIATRYKSDDVIPVNTNTPIEGFKTKTEAIENLKTKINATIPIYLYEIKADQFILADGKLIANKTLYPSNMESMLLT